MRDVLSSSQSGSLYIVAKARPRPSCEIPLELPSALQELCPFRAQLPLELGDQGHRPPVEDFMTTTRLLAPDLNTCSHSTSLVLPSLPHA